MAIDERISWSGSGIGAMAGTEAFDAGRRKFVFEPPEFVPNERPGMDEGELYQLLDRGNAFASGVEDGKAHEGFLRSVLVYLDRLFGLLATDRIVEGKSTGRSIMLEALLYALGSVEKGSDEGSLLAGVFGPLLDDYIDFRISEFLKEVSIHCTEDGEIEMEFDEVEEPDDGGDLPEGPGDANWGDLVE
jgi:hypothetical protein